MVIRSRIPLSVAGVTLVLFALASLVGCGVESDAARRSAPKPISIELDAAEVKIVEARFDSAEIEFVQGEQDKIVIEGELFCEASDQHAAEIHISNLELQIVHGRVTLISLPASPEGFGYRANLRVTVPRSVNLRVLQGEGRVTGDIQLPLMTDIQLGTGAVDLRLPRDTSAFVSAQVNIATQEDFVVGEFARVNGEPARQLTHVLFEGQLGTPLQLVGSQLEVRVNAGSCRIRAQEATPANP